MSKNYNQMSTADNIRFTHALFSEAEHSTMLATPVHLTTFNAGDIVPIYCNEILPDEDVEFDLDAVIRQTTLLTPTMGNMHVDIYAFFVPNRVVNQSWKAVQGENLSGSWTAPQVSLAPLLSGTDDAVTVPVGSVADYYGFPTQSAIPANVLELCHDLKFRGYVMIWNEFFRDQNYQPPIPMSTLNIYQGFMESNRNQRLALASADVSGVSTLGSSVRPDGSYPFGAVANALYGSGISPNTTSIGTAVLSTHFNALGSPLKANKLHDYFTSVLPSPQKAQTSVFAPATGTISANVPQLFVTTLNSDLTGPLNNALRWKNINGNQLSSTSGYRGLGMSVTAGNLVSGSTNLADGATAGNGYAQVAPSNLGTIATSISGIATGIGISVDDLRMAAAIQQVYEIQARGGSRYREIVQSFFGITADNPYSDIPTCLGHISRDLDLFQTAQTSASESGSTPQGNLSAFGYTSTSGSLFKSKFLEHGYLHVFAVVRHRNVYPSMLDRDNFRLNMLDFYLPPLANISEQPVYSYQINPFGLDAADNVFGYQEPWAEYRYEPDKVSGYMRPGIDNSLSLWNYADNFDSGLTTATGAWLRSNSQEVLDRTLAVTSSVAPQFKAHFKFYVKKTLPMPTYSVPGMDII